MIIGISGKQRSGKDTLAALLLNYMPQFKKIGLADALKDEYCALNGVDRENIDYLKNKYPEYRKALIDYGNFRRSQYENYWVNKVLTQDNIIVSDIRFKNEAKAFNEKGALLIRVNSSLENRQKRGTLSNQEDSSEIDLDNYTKFTYIIENDHEIDYLDQYAKPISDIYNHINLYNGNIKFFNDKD